MDVQNLDSLVLISSQRYMYYIYSDICNTLEVQKLRWFKIRPISSTSLHRFLKMQCSFVKNTIKNIKVFFVTLVIIGIICYKGR